MTRNRRRQRSQLSSASSEGNSPDAKRLNSTERNASSSSAQTQLTPMSENTGTADNSYDKPSISEIWKILKAIQTDVARILNENQEIRKDIDELKASLQFNEKNVAEIKKGNESLVLKTNDLENKLATAEKTIHDLERQVENLEFDHDTLEQYTRKFNVEVHGIPECEGENLREIVIKVGQKISVDVSDNDIDIVHRLYRKPPANKPIIVRFTSHKKKREFYRSRLNLKNTNLSGIFGCGCFDSEARIFINENLTQKRQELLASARNMKRARKLNQVWTVDGKIFARKKEDSRPVRINDRWDLENLAS